jgi:hypothetical protein
MWEMWEVCTAWISPFFQSSKFFSMLLAKRERFCRHLSHFHQLSEILRAVDDENGDDISQPKFQTFLMLLSW